MYYVIYDDDKIKIKLKKIKKYLGASPKKIFNNENLQFK